MCFVAVGSRVLSTYYLYYDYQSKKSADQMYSLKIGQNQMYSLRLTLWNFDFLRTHLSYRKNSSRTHSTPVSTTKLLFVLTSDSCVLTLDALVSQLYSLHANLMQGSHSSIFDVLCTHFRFTNKQSVLTTVPGESKCTHFMVIFVPP